MNRRNALHTLTFALAGLGSVANAEDQPVLARQVTVFGVLATPKGTTVDPKLKPVEDQLKKLLPNHGFKLIKIESKRMGANELLLCDLTSGFLATATLLQPLDADGKVQMQVDLTHNGLSQYQSRMSTPPNQIFFCDKQLPNGERLLIGVGAR